MSSKKSRRRRREEREAQQGTSPSVVRMVSPEPLDDPDVSSLEPVVTNEEILRIEAVMRKLHERTGTSYDLESFRREIIDRFVEVGFALDVLVYEVTYHGSDEKTYKFVPKLTGRFGAPDLDRMVNDMIQDSLGLDEGGVITSDGKVQSAPSKTSLYIPPSARS